MFFEHYQDVYFSFNIYRCFYEKKINFNQNHPSMGDFLSTPNMTEPRFKNLTGKKTDKLNRPISEIPLKFARVFGVIF